MNKASIYLFYLLCTFSPSYASSGVNSITCDDDLMLDGKIHSSAKITLVKSLDDNLGLFKIHNQSDVDLEISIAGIQDGYYRHPMFWGYLYILNLSEQEKGWRQSGVYDEEENDEVSSTVRYEAFDYKKRILIPPKQSIEFITLLWPRGWEEAIKEKIAVRLYMSTGLYVDDQYLNLVISEPYCLRRE